MKDLIDRALDAAEGGGADYTEVRVAERETEQLTVKNGALEAATSNVSFTEPLPFLFGLTRK